MYPTAARIRAWDKANKKHSLPSETSSDWSVRSLDEFELGRTAHTREKRMGQTNAKLEELAKTNPREAARKRRNAHMDSLRHARDRAEAKANSPIIEKESPLEEKVVSSTPVMRAPIAKQGTHRAREMVSTRFGEMAEAL